MFVGNVQATPTCHPPKKTQKGLLDEQSADRLTIMLLDLSEINILYTLQMSVVVT